MKKVLIITYYWPPSGGAGVQRWVKFAKYFSRLNVETHVLTVDPQFATYPQIDESLIKDIPSSVIVHYAKSFEIYSIYKKVSDNKEVPYGGFANTKKVNFKEKVFRFIRGNFFIPDPRKGWNKYALKKAEEIISTHGIKTIITTSPPHSTQLIGLKLKNKLNLKWIADLRDPWTDIFYYKDLYPTKIAREINKNFENRILTNSDILITVSDALKTLFAQKVKNISNKISVIPNGFDTEDFPEQNIELSSTNFYISYVGTISADYPIEGFIKAIKQLPEEIISKLKIRFIGKISEQQQQLFYNSGLKDKLEIVGYVEHIEAIRYMMSSHLLLLIIPKIENNEGILTGKLFEYLGARRSILLLGPEKGDAANIIRETKSGDVCDYYNEQQISATIKDSFYRHENYKKSNINIYSREKLTNRLIEVLDI